MIINIEYFEHFCKFNNNNQLWKDRKYFIYYLYAYIDIIVIWSLLNDNIIVSFN